MTRAFSSNLRGKVRNFPLPKNKPLIPLYEAVVNAINAIDERREKGDEFEGEVSIEVLRDRSLLPESDCSPVTGFRVRDNGIGFDENNMNSFMEADSEYKIAIGGKGVGRFSWLKAFTSVHVVSSFKENGSFHTRKFDFTIERPDINDSTSEAENDDYLTEISLENYRRDYSKEVPRQLDALATCILQHCVVYFLRDACPEIKIYDDRGCISLNQIFKQRFSADTNKVEFRVGDYLFSLLNIKINDRSFKHKNRLYLCANERLVDSKDLEKHIVNLDSNIFDEEGYWYLGIVTGSYLDENVDMNRLSFDIQPENYGLLDEDRPGLDCIVESACQEITAYLSRYLERVEEKKIEAIQSYVESAAPQYRHLRVYAPDAISALKPNLKQDELDDALYKIKRELENKTNSECKSLLSKLANGLITTEEYQARFQESIGKISDINGAALAEYVAHRRVILDLFAKGLDIKPDGKFNLEKYMHELIYPMRATSEETPYERHNLWLIDDRLSFSKFLSSDMPFDNDKGNERIDLLALDRPVAVADCKNTGVYDSIVVFELKRPGRDDYNWRDNPISQLIDYVKKIKSGFSKDCKQRPIRTSEATQFHLYAVCDITPSLEDVLVNMGFCFTPDKLGAYWYNPALKAYLEVLSYDKIKKRL